MRISTGYQFDSYSRDIRRTQSAFFEAQQQVTTGRRINKPSDDPLGTSLSLNMRTLRGNIEQYRENIKTAKGILGYTETALTESSTLTRRAYQLAVQAANGATGQEGREAMVSEINQLQQRVLNLANSRGPSGQYLFAGQRNDQPPFTIGMAGIVYNGDANNVVVETDPVNTMVVNTQGNPLYTNLYNQLETLKTNLMGGNVSAISGIDIANLQASQQAFDQARGAVGAKIRTIDDLTSHYDRRTDELTNGISDVEEVDYSEAILKYKQAEAAYTGALTVASQGFRQSLMDFIRG